MACTCIPIELGSVHPLKSNPTKWLLNNVLIHSGNAVKNVGRKVKPEATASFQFKRCSVNLVLFFPARVLGLRSSVCWCSYLPFAVSELTLTYASISMSSIARHPPPGLVFCGLDLTHDESQNPMCQQGGWLTTLIFEIFSLTTKFRMNVPTGSPSRSKLSSFLFVA